MTAEPLIFKTKEEELQASQAFNKLRMGRRGGGRGLAKLLFPSSASFSLRGITPQLLTSLRRYMCMECIEIKHKQIYR